MILASTTSSPSCLNLIPRTPRVERPCSRVFSISNLIHCASFVTIKRYLISWSAIFAVMSSSPSSSTIARTPLLLMLLNSLRFVRFTTPFFVKNTNDFSSEKSVVGMIDWIFSSAIKLMRLTTAFPFAVLLPSGIL